MDRGRSFDDLWLWFLIWGLLVIGVLRATVVGAARDA
jgi:hypothetical protein